MPIVVVHGVNTRKDEPGYKASGLDRVAAWRAHCRRNSERQGGHRYEARFSLLG